MAFILFSFCLDASLIDVYKKGLIKLIPDAEFGIKTDWESLFYDSYKDILITPHGNILVANSRSNNIFEFNLMGKKIKTIGKPGLGPGDTQSPSIKSSLDEKYIVVGDSPANHKLSIFDFSGKCVAALRTKNFCYSPVGLKNGYIAYQSIISKPSNRNDVYRFSYVINIIDIDSKSEIQFSFKDHERRIILISTSSKYSITFSTDSYIGTIFLKKTVDGNLLLSLSNSPDIFIYSTEGKLLRRFSLNIHPTPVNDLYIAKVKALVLKKQPRKIKPEYIKKIDKFDFRLLFNKNLPYYKDIIVDSEGNFLVFKWTDSFDTTKETFQVYSPQGKYICETVLDKGEFQLEIDPRFNHIQFDSSGIYAYVSKEGDEDTVYRLIKVKI